MPLIRNQLLKPFGYKTVNRDVTHTFRIAKIVKIILTTETYGMGSLSVCDCEKLSRCPDCSRKAHERHSYYSG